LRLMTSSNLVGWLTGRSAGFSSLRIRPTYTLVSKCVAGSAAVADQLTGRRSRGIINSRNRVTRGKRQ
jgi:hypothetical protein